jgi:hypothetical protein
MATFNVNAEKTQLKMAKLGAAVKNGSADAIKGAVGAEGVTTMGSLDSLS